MADGVEMERLDVSEDEGSEETQGETAAMVGRGSLVFFGGMALAAASFLVERAVVRAIHRA